MSRSTLPALLRFRTSLHQISLDLRSDLPASRLLPNLFDFSAKRFDFVNNSHNSILEAGCFLLIVKKEISRICFQRRTSGNLVYDFPVRQTRHNHSEIVFAHFFLLSSNNKKPSTRLACRGRTK